MEKRLIDAVAFEQSVTALMEANGIEDYRLQAFSADDIARLIDTAPTVDAVEVVRCKDCGQFKRGKYSGGTCLLTGRYRAVTNGFCLHGIKVEGKCNGVV